MCSTKTLDIKKKDDNLYLPQVAKITKVDSFTAYEKFFEVELVSGKPLGHDPGQFVQLSILGIGEAPISISSPPSKDNKFQMVVRAVGDVTKALHAKKVGDEIMIRGPFGHGFDDKIQKKMEGKHLVFIAGGIGYVPLRSLLNKVIAEKKKYKKITVLYGCKNPDCRMYCKELEEIKNMGGNVEIFETVDQNTHDDWEGNVGVITTLIPKVKVDPKETIAIIVGPPIMYKFVLVSLLEKNISQKNIYMSLERRMKCGIGKCGHCQMNDKYVCMEGPVFRYSDLGPVPEAI